MQYGIIPFRVYMQTRLRVFVMKFPLPFSLWFRSAPALIIRRHTSLGVSKGRANGPVLTYGFLVALDHSGHSGARGFKTAKHSERQMRPWFMGVRY